MNNALILYQNEILEFGRKPRNFAPLADATVQVNGDSPICGDHLTLYLRIEQQQIVDATFFSSACCAVCRASSSMMTDAIKGQSVHAVAALRGMFLAMMESGAAPQPEREQMGRLTVFERIKEAPSRIECAALAWNTLSAALAMPDPIAAEAAEGIPSRFPVPLTEGAAA